MTRPTVSTLTIALGRSEHLANVVLGFARQSVPPDELVVTVMQDALYQLPEAPFPIRQIRVPGAELPLAAARNAAANAARGEVLVFVDVDCIPGESLVADYGAVARPEAGIFMGEVLYLPAGAAAPGWREATFAERGVRHFDRQGLPKVPVRVCAGYRCFRSLNFALHAADWHRSGGLDTRYRGYSGEDTDFARSLDAAGVAISWIRGARVYHQYHPHSTPPIHHVASVVRNAELFAEKWGYRTMEHWLYAFTLIGLIEDRADGLHVLRAPSEAERDLCRQGATCPTPRRPG